MINTALVDELVTLMDENIPLAKVTLVGFLYFTFGLRKEAFKLGFTYFIHKLKYFFMVTFLSSNDTFTSQLNFLCIFI